MSKEYLNYEELDSLIEEILRKQGPKQRSELYKEIKNRGYKLSRRKLNKALKENKYKNITWKEIKNQYNIFRTPYGTNPNTKVYKINNKNKNQQKMLKKYAKQRAKYNNQT